MHRACVLSLALLMGIATTAPTLEARAERSEGSLNRSAKIPRGPFFVGEGSFSILSDSAERSVLGNSFGYGLHGGYHWDIWGVYLHVEHNLWISSELSRQITTGALNVGLGGAYFYHEGRARTSVTVGPSMLLFDTLLDDAGEVGFFVEIRPVGLRWNVGEEVFMILDPLAIAVVAPVLEGIPLAIVQYRTMLGIEFDI